MTTATHIPDVQDYADSRNITIDQVGVKRVKYPAIFNNDNIKNPCVVEFAMSVALPAEKKGTHMSRFVKIIHESFAEFSIETMRQQCEDMLNLLNAKEGCIELSFDYFRDKKAPVTGMVSKMDYRVEISIEKLSDDYLETLSVTVPVQSLCPCSKEISAYGAHNQRSHIIINAYNAHEANLNELIDIAEKQASVELYGLLKREDEKSVTEHAYDNPKFVEDIVRDVANALIEYPKIEQFNVEVENFESIHNHSAFAEITYP